MSVKLRLARGGSKKRPFYRIVAADTRSPRDGRFIEKLGTWNPILPKDSEKRVTLDEDRIKHWLSVGAKPTDRVLRFLDEAGILKREARNNPQKAVPGKKRQEREAAAAEAKKAAEAEAQNAAEETPAAETEAPAEEAPAEEAPAAEAPAEETAADEPPAEEAVAEEAPAEEPKAEEASAEAAPAEDTPAEDEAKS